MARRKSGQQPTRAPSGGKFGARQQLEAAQRAIPLPDVRGGRPPEGGSPAPPPPAAGGQPEMPPVMVERPDIFGPTTRPDEPVSAGAVGEFGLLPQPPAELIRAMYLRYPNRGLRRLLEFAVRMERGVPGL